MKMVTQQHGNYLITTDRSQLQPDVIHNWLSTESYWAKGIPYPLFKASFDHSFVIGALYERQQIGYARLITDYATFAYLADVYVAADHRGKGLSKAMMDIIMGLDWVIGLRRIMLATLDAHGLYELYGFDQPKFPARLMEITRPNIYEGQKAEDDLRQKIGD